jgi:membrane protein YdbS with pleckstrin-like domain
MRQPNPKRGKASIKINFFLLTSVIIGLSVYFTVHSLWQVATVVIVVLLLLTAGFYLWLWRVYFK